MDSDKNTCFIHLKCLHFARNLFLAYSKAPHQVIDIIDKMSFGEFLGVVRKFLTTHLLLC